MSEQFDPYAVLELSRSCTDDEINVAFKTASRRYHPDRPGGDGIKFGQCSKAKNLLLDREKRRLYDMGGWGAVDQHEQMQQIHRNRNMKCEPVNLNLEVTLVQLYRRDTIPIKVTLPGNSGEFSMDLKLDPGMLGHGLCVENRGISKEDYITGDVIIHVNLDKKEEFKVQGLDIILEIKMSIADLLGYSIQIDHPSGAVYSIHGKYENPDKNGNIIKYYPTMGLTGGDDTGNMIIVIIPDFTNLSKLPKKIVQEIQALLSSSRKYTPDTVSSKAIDITEKSIAPRQRGPPGIQFMSSINGMPVPMPMGMMEGRPGECPVS
jgi:DnaJ-class molecular chaperone